MASSSASGMMTSRISTDCTWIPQSCIFWSSAIFEPVAELLARLDQLRQVVLADGVAERGLRRRA